jgi:site-specific DNA-methyltransferase (cytosine-N4-specific)
LIYATASDWTLHVGDARNVLASMPEGYADCIVTSPPYWAKHDFGVAGQYGLEPDPDGYIATLRSLFREAHRVLAADGTCWLNLGDSYSAGSASQSGPHAYLGPGLAGRIAPGMATRNLLGLPWRDRLHAGHGRGRLLSWRAEVGTCAGPSTPATSRA